MKKVLFVLGTRPEAIKLAPLIKACALHPQFDCRVCLTAQHREMLDQVIDFFGIQVDYDLNLMQNNQSLLQLMSKATDELEKVIEDYPADVVVVQGDTSTVLVGALVGFYKRTKIAHIEAGLRSFDKNLPFPEEMNRLLTSQLADFHFAPTQKAFDNLTQEGFKENLYMVGNTVIDALNEAVLKVEQDEDHYQKHFSQIDFSKKVILVTCHRRESFGKPFEEICKALLHIADSNSQVEIVYPVHLNPNVKLVAERMLVRDNIKLIQPLSYPYLVWLMNKSHIILTDSGGIQEEAPTLGKPVLVMRDVTERMEGVESGTAKLVGTSKSKIISEVEKLLSHPKEYEAMSKANNPYGDGTSSNLIMDVLAEKL